MGDRRVPRHRVHGVRAGRPVRTEGREVRLAGPRRVRGDPRRWVAACRSSSAAVLRSPRWSSVTVSLVVLASCQYPANVQSQMIVIFAYIARRVRPTGAKRAIGLAVDRCRLAIGRCWSAFPTSSGANLALSGAFYAASYAIGSSMRNRRLYIEQLEQRAATSNANATKRRSGPSPTSACASPRSCTTSSRTRWASSPCRPAWART